MLIPGAVGAEEGKAPVLEAAEQRRSLPLGARQGAGVQQRSSGSQGASEVCDGAKGREVAPAQGLTQHRFQVQVILETQGRCSRPYGDSASSILAWGQVWGGQHPEAAGPAHTRPGAL